MARYVYLHSFMNKRREYVCQDGQYNGGYDHNYFSSTEAKQIFFARRLFDESIGISQIGLANTLKDD